MMIMTNLVRDDAIDILMSEGVDEAIFFIQRNTRCSYSQAKTVVVRLLSELGEDYEID